MGRWKRIKNVLIIKKEINRAGADVGLMFYAYNLRRSIYLVDKNLLIKFLRGLWLMLFEKIAIVKAIVRLFFETKYFHNYILLSNYVSYKKLY